MFRFPTHPPNSPTYSTKPPRLISPPPSTRPSLIFSLKKSLLPSSRIPKPNLSSLLVVSPLIKPYVKTPKNWNQNSKISNVISHSRNFLAITPPWLLPPLIMKFYPASNLPTPTNSISFPVPKLNSLQNIIQSQFFYLKIRPVSYIIKHN